MDLTKDPKHHIKCDADQGDGNTQRQENTAADDHSCRNQVAYQQVSEYACEYRFKCVNDGSVAGTDQFDSQTVE